MSMQDIAAAMQRAEAALQRRPDIGLHDDAPATARWEGGTRVVSSHANGTQMPTDMPGELGGSGDRVTPGWLFRAGLASCAATSIAMAAAAEGIELARARGPRQQPLRHARPARHGRTPTASRCTPGRATCSCTCASPPQGVAPERLRALVEDGVRRSPMPSAVADATPLALQHRRRRRLSRPWTRCPKPCASCAWSAPSSSMRRFTAPWCYQSPQRRHGGARCWSPAPSGW